MHRVMKPYNQEILIQTLLPFNATCEHARVPRLPGAHDRPFLNDTYLIRTIIY